VTDRLILSDVETSQMLDAEAKPSVELAKILSRAYALQELTDV